MKRETASCCLLLGGLNEKELYIITFLGVNKKAKMKDVAADMNIPMSTLTSIVDKLVKNDFISRYHSAEDRRVIEIKLTKKGMDSFDLFMTRKRSSAEKILSKFNTEEQESMIRCLENLAINK